MTIPSETSTPARHAETVTVLGAGAWGLTLADLMARNGHRVMVWDRKPAALDDVRTKRGRGAPAGLVVHESVDVEPDFDAAVGRSGIVLGCVPSYALREIAGRIAAMPGGLGGRAFVNTAKGIEEETLMLPWQVFAQVMAAAGATDAAAAAAGYAVLAGPSHAEEVCKGMPTTVVVSSASTALAHRVQALFRNRMVRVYTQNDVIGCELGGALKNVVAIAAGGCDALRLGDNTKAALLTRALAEICRAGKAMGAAPATLSGLAGLGDLIVTTLSKHSRNRKFGELTAGGAKPEEALAAVGAVVEGYRTARSARMLGQRLGVDMPIVETVYRCLYESAPILESIHALFDRDPRAEQED